MSSWNGTKIGLRVDSSEEEQAQEFLTLLGLRLYDDIDEEIGELSCLDDYSVVGTVQDDLLGIMPSLEKKFSSYQNQFYGSEDENEDQNEDEIGTNTQLDDLFLLTKKLFHRPGMFLAHEDGNSVSDTYYRYEVIYNAGKKTELNCFYSYGDGINTGTDNPVEEGLVDTKEKLKAKEPSKNILDLLTKKAETEGFTALLEKLQGKSLVQTDATNKEKKKAIKKIPGLKVVKGIVVGYTGNDEELEIPEGVTEIGDKVFSFNFNLNKIKLPNTLERIGIKSFRDCRNLIEIEIPESVKSIGAEAFLNCKNLKEITIPKAIDHIEKNTFSDCAKLQTVILQNGLKKIDDGAFRNCEALKVINLPDTITNIGNYAFWFCEQLTEVTLPKGLEKIGNYAFFGCYALKKIIAPQALQQIIEESKVYSIAKEPTDVQYV